MDEVSSWILDFILRQPIPDSILFRIFLPITAGATNHPLHRKSILLRRIRSDLSHGTISESTLTSLELIEELDRDRGKPPSISIRSAYADVAVECTLNHLRTRPHFHQQSSSSSSPHALVPFLDAVNRIWNCRVADLERSDAVGLLSGKLKKWRRDMELAVGDPEVRTRMLTLQTKADTLRSVGEYVREAWEEMGPSFLEIKAQEFMNSRHPDSDKSCVEIGKGSGFHHQKRMPEAQQVPEMDCHAGVAESSDQPDKFEVLYSGLDRERARRALEQGLGAGHAIPDIGRGTSQATRAGSALLSSNCNLLSTPDVIKVREALRINCNNLHAVVKDPLPAAVAVAAKVLASSRNMAGEPKESDYNENDAREDISHPSHMIADGTCMDRTADIQPMMNNGGKSIPTLMERNPASHYSEWRDDSIDSPQDAPDSAKRVCLPSLRKRKTLSLKAAEAPKFTIRRKKHKWSSLEEETLGEAVKKYGKGNWKFILNCYPSIFLERTEVDLKDKWRNMNRHL